MRKTPEDSSERLQEIQEAFDLARLLISKMLLLPVPVRKQIAANVAVGYDLFKDVTIER